MNFILETSDRKGTHTQRVRIPERGLTVGRAWDSDVIVQDKYVDAHHLIFKVDEYGTVFVGEHDSLNGTLLAGQPIRGGANAYHFGDPIRVGDTTLRLIEATSAVPAAEPRSSWFSMISYFYSWKALLLITGCAILAETLKKAAISASDFNLGDALLYMLIAASVVFFWGLLFGGLSKLVRGQAHIREHWALCALYLIASAATTLLVNFLRFNVQSYEFGVFISALNVALLNLLLVFGLLTYITHLEEKSKWLWSALVMMVLFASPYVTRFTKEEHELWLNRVETETTMLPPVFMVRDPISLDDYFEQTDQLFKNDD